MVSYYNRMSGNNVDDFDINVYIFMYVHVFNYPERLSMLIFGQSTL
jgi:hypothetical protein